MFAGAFADVDALVCYAMKANSNQAVVRDLGQARRRRRRGFGRRAQARAAAGVPPDKIMFSGIGKTADELALAVDEGILCINVESEPELEMLSSIAAGQGPHRAHLGARQSRHRSQDAPQDRDRQGREQVRHSDQPRARRSMRRPPSCTGLKVAGVDMHIGSQITDLDPFGDAFALLADFVRELRADGHAISHVDLGGGLGIPYRDDNEPPPRPEHMRGGQARDPRA